MFVTHRNKLKRDLKSSRKLKKVILLAQKNNINLSSSRKIDLIQKWLKHLKSKVSNFFFRKGAAKKYFS